MTAERKDDWPTRGQSQTMADLGLLRTAHAHAMRATLDLTAAKLHGDEAAVARIMDTATPDDIGLMFAAALSLLAEEIRLVGNMTGQDPGRLVAELRVQMRQRFADVGVRWTER